MINSSPFLAVLALITFKIHGWITKCRIRITWEMHVHMVEQHTSILPLIAKLPRSEPIWFNLPFLEKELSSILDPLLACFLHITPKTPQQLLVILMCAQDRRQIRTKQPNSEISMKCLLLKTRPNQLQVWWNLVTTHLKMSTNTPNWKYSNTWSSLITIQKFLQTSNLNCFCDLWSKTLAHLFFHNSNDYTTRLNKKLDSKIPKMKKRNNEKDSKMKETQWKYRRKVQMRLYCTLRNNNEMGQSRNLWNVRKSAQMMWFNEYRIFIDNLVKDERKIKESW